MLSKRASDALQFIAGRQITGGRWLRDGDDAYGPRETWNGFEFVGERQRFRVNNADFEAIRPFLDLGPFIDAAVLYRVRAAGLLQITTPPHAEGQVQP